MFTHNRDASCGRGAAAFAVNENQLNKYLSLILCVRSVFIGHSKVKNITLQELYSFICYFSLITFHLRFEYLLKTFSVQKMFLNIFGSIPLTARLLTFSRATKFECKDRMWSIRNDLNSKCSPQNLHPKACPFMRLSLCFWHDFLDICCFGQKRHTERFILNRFMNVSFVLPVESIRSLIRVVVSGTNKSNDEIDSLSFSFECFIFTWDESLKSFNWTMSTSCFKTFLPKLLFGILTIFLDKCIRFCFLSDFVIFLISFLREVRLSSPPITLVSIDAICATIIKK